MTPDEAVGKRVLVGVTYLEADGVTVIARQQTSGTITRVDAQCVYVRDDVTGEEVTFPPDLEAFEPAPPGEYRLRESGRVVTDPDLLAQWTVHRPG